MVHAIYETMPGEAGWGTLEALASSIFNFRAVIGSTGGGEGLRREAVLPEVTSSSIWNPPLEHSAFFLAAAALRFRFFLEALDFGLESD